MHRLRQPQRRDIGAHGLSVTVGWVLALMLICAPGGSIGAVLDGDEVERFADRVLEPAMAQAGVPGLIVAIVDSGGVVLTKGYGTYDLSSDSPVTADTTLFNTASIGKLFTAILVAQLVEEGQVSLDVDVNDYLTDIRVSGDPVTLRELLGHGGGFGKELSYLFTGQDGSVEMPVETINRRLTRDAGATAVPSYDNVGFGLIGLVMESVTGQAFPDLVEQRIISPLALSGAAYGLSVPAGKEHAKCYVTLGVSVQACELLGFRQLIRGAGGVSLTAESAARFMQMLLSGGALDGVTILSPDSYQAVFNLDAYRFHPALAGLGWAFQGVPDPGRKVVGHTGSMPGFSSAMRLYPESGVGVFVSFMGGQPASFDATLSHALQLALQPVMPMEARAGLAALHGFAQAFANTFLPETPAVTDAPQVQPTSMDTPKEVTGNYYPTGPEYRSLLLRVRHWGQAFPVAAVSESAITFAGQGPFERRGPYLYVDEGGRQLAFQEHGATMYVAIGTSIATLVRKSAWQARGWSVPWGVLATVLVLSSAVYLRPGARGPFRRLAAYGIAAVVLVLAVIAAELQYGEFVRATYGEMSWSLFWYAMLLGSALLLLTCVRFVRIAWSVANVGRVWSTLLRAHALLIGFACLLLLGVIALILL